MNKELIAPALTELLHNTRKLEEEAVEQRKLLQKLIGQNSNKLDAATMEKLLHVEMEKLKMELHEKPSLMQRKA